MAWKATIGDKSMMLDDLSENDFVAACGDHDINWLRLYISPGAHPGALYNLLCIVARKLEVASPDKPQNVKEAVALLKHIEQVSDDLPKAGQTEESHSKGPDDRETTTPSTSTEREGGTPSKHDEPH
jgi:hypothetical protein